MKTLYINNPSTDIFFNLATEEYLLKYHPENIFMLWQNSPSVVLGKHQNAEAEIDLDFTREHQIAVARRYSGGGTVYHDLSNLNLTFIENTNKADFGKYTRQTIEFLQSLGIEAQEDKRLGININQLKISGSAQCIYKSRVLYHCTLLYDTDLSALTSSLQAKPEQIKNIPYIVPKFNVPSVKSPVTNIIKHIQNPPDIGSFKHTLFDFFFKTSPKNEIYYLSEEDITRITQLKSDKYASPRWIYNRTF